MNEPKKTPRMGRPPVADKDCRTTHIKVLLTVGEREALEHAAKPSGHGVSTRVRTVALERARTQV